MDQYLTYKAIITGIVFLIIGLLISMIFGFLKPELPTDCEIWDKYYVMEVTFFFSGFVFRFLLENSEIKSYII